MNRIALALPLVFLCAHLGSAQPLDLRGKTLPETFAEVLPGLAKADSGAQQRWQNLCNRAGAPGNEKQRDEACVMMVEKLDAKTPTVVRIWLLVQLQRIGREEAVAPVALLLEDQDADVREAAVRALANNPSPKATRKLADKLAKVTGPSLKPYDTKVKIGLLNALGHRGDPAAVTLLAKNLDGTGTAEVAAARALGRIPGEDAAKALAAARPKAKGEVRSAIADAQIVHADRLLKAGKTAEAAAIYKELNVADEPRPIRSAALRGSIQTAGDAAGDLVLSTLAGDDTGARAIAIGEIENLSAGALKPLAASLEKLPVPSRVAVVTAIAARGDKSQLPVALTAAKSADGEVKRAGILALGRLGDASTVEFLLDAMSAKDATAGIAAESLAALPAEGVNEKIIAVLEAEKIAARIVALCVILERRKAVSAAPALLKVAGSADAGVRTAAFAGLKTLAAKEQIPGMVAALKKTEKGKEREQAEIAIVAVVARLPASEKMLDPVIASIDDDSKDLNDLYPLLGRLGSAPALMLIRKALAGNDAAAHDAAFTGLCNWPDASANNDLLSLAEKGKDAAEKQRALGALIRVNAVLVERTPDERLATLGVLKKAMALASRDDERRAFLEGVGFVRHIETLHFVLPYLDKPELAQAACKGVVELAHSKMLREPNKAEFAKALDRVIAMCKDKALVDRAKAYKEGR